MTKNNQAVLDATDIYYKQFNEQIRALVREGKTEFILNNVNGQRYIATGLEGEYKFVINGVPGQDLAAFTRGSIIRVNGNVQDGVGNTMDDGKIVVDGMGGDVVGYAMRGGKIYIRTDVGYRVGIHMKSYLDKQPTIVIGGKAGDFLGEYMAGGIILLLGMFSDKPDAPITGRSLGTGMHGGVIYIRGEVPEHQLGPGLRSRPVDSADMKVLEEIVWDYAEELGLDAEEILSESFTKVRPFSHRPYGNMYVPT
jgi:glutamate synthase (NADPH) GltB3 subunit (EC 1.4.1.13)